MIAISFWEGELILTAIWLLVRIAVWIRQRRIDWKREAMLLLMYLNLFVIVRIVFFPMHRLNGKVQPLLFDPSAVYPFWTNFVPFLNLLNYESTFDLLLNVIGNVLLFVPTGFLLPFLYKKFDTFPKTVLAGLSMSLLIELLQLPFFQRQTDVDDLILNTLGTAIGFLIWLRATKPKEKEPASGRPLVG